METGTGGYVRIRIQCELVAKSVQLFVRACVRRSSIVQCPGPRSRAVGEGGPWGVSRGSRSRRGNAQRLLGFAPGVGGGVSLDAGGTSIGSEGFRGVIRYGWRDAGNSFRTCS